MKRILALAVLLAIAAAATTQQADQAKPQPKEGTKLFASPPQSLEMAKMVDSFAGLWKTTIHVYKGEWFPAEGTANGRAEIHAGPAGNSLAEQFHSNGPQGTFAGHGVYWYDKDAGRYQGLWCDSMDPRGCASVGKGTWQGDNLIFINDIDMGNTKMQIRETYSNMTKNSFDFMIEAGTTGSVMTKMMTIRYERSVPRSAADKK